MHERCMKKVTGEIMTASQQYSTFSPIQSYTGKINSNILSNGLSPL